MIHSRRVRGMIMRLIVRFRFLFRHLVPSVRVGHLLLFGLLRSLRMGMLCEGGRNCECCEQRCVPQLPGSMVPKHCQFSCSLLFCCRFAVANYSFDCTRLQITAP